MGANWVTVVYDDKPTAELREQFQKVQESDLYENGHSYSGGFGMASGLVFNSRDPFESVDAADEHLQELSQKWDDAQAVRFKDSNGVIKWLIGAWCAC